MPKVLRPIVLATLVCGTLDIAFATLLTVLRGRPVAGMLRFVASGPVPPAVDWGVAGAALGLAVHYLLMAIMAAVLMLFVARRAGANRSVLVLGVGYGLVTWVVMNFIVVPLRFDTPFPPDPVFSATQLFAHVVLVGLPMALIARRQRFE
ncbi:MAG: hypothetical protein CMLOHMNK_01530 [Steroidobacteraceae bacterium]|nr:hypothetical protein [Steroidobacteraceae bacterium]